MQERKLSQHEIDVIEELGHPLYTPEFVQEWINRNDNVMTNAIAALQNMAASGFYSAVQCIVKNLDGNTEPNG